MGVRIRVAEGEPINLVLRRLQKLLERTGVKWEMRRRGYLVAPRGVFYTKTQTRRAKRFQKKFKAREAMLIAQMAAVQPVTSLEEAREKFWRRTGKP